MNREDIEHMWKVASNDPNHDTNWHDPVVVAFANLVAKHTLANIDPSSFMTWQEGYEAGKQTEREAWEHRYARLQSLMDVRETQPNKPCCLAEREKYEAIITNMTKLLEAQQNREGVAVDMIAAGIAAEREACIDLVAMYGGPVDLEAAIRARGQA